MDQETAVDEEGLQVHYDVILCGTGLVQAILSSALARAGKSVLHVDGSSNYGELESVWSYKEWLDQFEKQETTQDEHCEFQSSRDDIFLPLHRQGSLHSLRIHSLGRPSWPVAINNKVVTPYGRGTVVELQEISSSSYGYHRMVIRLDRWTLADQSRALLFLQIPSSSIVIVETPHRSASVDPDYLWKIHNIRMIQAETAARVLQTDSCKKLLFDITPLLLYAQGPAVDALLESSVADYLEFKSLEGLLYLEKTKNNNGLNLSRVPCNKNDVFASKLLSVMDKRRLMKFLQTTYDFATSQQFQQGQEGSANDQVLSWNEMHLNQGRSLSRPQNKNVANTELEHLQQLCEASSDSSFESYLRDNLKLSESLTKLVRYALALETDANETTTADGIRRLCAHMLALGRYGGTAFLVPLYGSGELSQAFCRSGAVFGATYLLRRTPFGLSLHDGALQSVRLGGPCDAEDDDTMTTKDISCSHAVFSESALLQRNSSRRVLRRISLVCGKPIVSEKSMQQRYVVVLPPDTLKNQPSAIHGLLLDEAVNVAPYVPGGCTLVHLTTTIDDELNVIDDTVLKDALRVILDRGGAKQDGTIVDEIFHVSFSYMLPLLSNNTKSTLNHGMHIVRRPRPGLTADDAFHQAASIFAKICPSESFLKIAKEVDTAIRENLGDKAFQEEDEEQEVLDSAVSMIDKSMEAVADDTGAPQK